jgi:hypothetical protein
MKKNRQAIAEQNASQDSHGHPGATPRWEESYDHLTGYGSSEPGEGKDGTLYYKKGGTGHISSLLLCFCYRIPWHES